jgi:hypothetical protein
VKKWLIVAGVLIVLVATTLPVSADGPPTHCPGWPNHTIPPGWSQPGPGNPGVDFVLAGANAGHADNAPGRFPHTIPPGWAPGPH